MRTTEFACESSELTVLGGLYDWAARLPRAALGLTAGDEAQVAETITTTMIASVAFFIRLDSPAGGGTSPLRGVTRAR